MNGFQLNTNLITTFSLTTSSLTNSGLGDGPRSNVSMESVRFRSKLSDEGTRTIVSIKGLPDLDIFGLEI